MVVRYASNEDGYEAIYSSSTCILDSTVKKFMINSFASCGHG